MKFNLKKELPLLVLVALPFMYLSYLWNSLPDKIPIHWNFKGEIDGWGSKIQLVYILFGLTVLSYVILLLIPLIDPKKKLEKMGNKFYLLKFWVVLLMSLIGLFILYSVQQSSSNIKGVYVLLGFMIMVFGNYFPTLKPNYLVGIKTPWTLENETVWKETHNLGGKLWFYGAAVLTMLVLLLPVESSFIVFMSGMLILVIVPIVFSYMRFNALKKIEAN